MPEDMPMRSATAQILVGRDVVAPEHRAGAMPADLHGDRLTHPSADHVPHAALVSVWIKLQQLQQGGCRFNATTPDWLSPRLVV